MNCRRCLRLVDDYLDCLLSPRRSARLEAHLTACPACRRAFQETAALRARLAALPRSFAPQTDLWDDIRERLPGRKDRRLTIRPMRLRLLAPLGAAVCALFLLLFALFSLPTSGGTPLAGRLVVISADHPAASLRDFRAIEMDYRQVKETMLSSLDSYSEGIDPRLVELVKTNLETIDRSVREIESALKKYPGEKELLRLLAAANSRRLDVLSAAQKQLMDL
jgi:hypothetical protein